MTLTGAGGVGKTRLAIEFAARSIADGIHVCVVELAAVDHPDRVPEAVAAGLSVREQPGRRLLEVLADVLRSHSLLLVLDNCEHLVGACAELADHLLRRCPRLRLLSTRREPLNMAGETAWRVPSLVIPSVSTDLDLQPLAQVEAVRLFVQRAAAVLPRFSLNEFNAAAVALRHAHLRQSSTARQHHSLVTQIGLEFGSRGLMPGSRRAGQHSGGRPRTRVLTLVAPPRACSGART